MIPYIFFPGWISEERGEYDVDDVVFAGDINKAIITIKLSKKPSNPCPECGETKTLFKEYKTRQIKHCLFQGRDTIFLLKERRYKCSSCGKTFTETNSLSPKRSRLSYELIVKILQLMMEWNSTVCSVAKQCRVSPTTVQNVFDNYVNIPRKSLPWILSIDECYNCNLFSDPYSCILFDFDNKKIIDIIEDRAKDNLIRYFNKIEKEERKNVKYVCIDMYDTYRDIATIFFPDALICIDSFHVIKNLNDALDKVRRRVMNDYDPKSKEYYYLKKYHDLLFAETIEYDEKQRIKKTRKWMNKMQIVQEMINIHPDLAAAYNFVHLYQHFNKTASYDEAKEKFVNYATSLMVVNVKEFMPILHMLQNWEEYIINSFKRLPDGRRISNGPIEGFNSNFKKSLTVANGYANFWRFRNHTIHRYNKEFKLVTVKTKIVKIKRKKRGKYNKKKTTDSG